MTLCLMDPEELNIQKEFIINKNKRDCGSLFMINDFLYGTEKYS
jgi:hypothetical protein